MAGPPYPVPNIAAPLAVVASDPTLPNTFTVAGVATPQALNVPNRLAPTAVVRMDPVTGNLF